MKKTIKKNLRKLFSEKFIEAGLDFLTFLLLQYYSIKFKPFIIRAATSDKFVFKSIFVLRELNLPNIIKPKFIIDGGAYTGLSTLFFSQKYPNAKIFAVEPEESNFQILKKHTEQIPNIKVFMAGLWHKKASLIITNKNVQKFCFTLQETKQDEPYDIISMTIEELLEISGFSKIDILKLDIEGSELELFSKNYEGWLKKVGILIIELHDSYKEGCKEAVFSAIDTADWEVSEQGEKVILIQSKFKKFGT